jgi:hypothetical protein
MRSFLLATIGIVLTSPTAKADGLSLAGSLWQCTRALIGLSSSSLSIQGPASGRRVRE